MLRSRLVFDRLSNFPQLEIDTVIPRLPKIRQTTESSTDLAHHLMRFAGP